MNKKYKRDNILENPPGGKKYKQLTLFGVIEPNPGWKWIPGLEYKAEYKGTRIRSYHKNN